MTERTSLPVHRDHRRDFASNVYVYPVVSRRSKGVSIGINLNPDKLCNFDCVYCQVDRSTPGPTSVVDLDRLADELEDLLDQAMSGRLFQSELFRGTPDHLRRLNDIAFAGDGEPTTCPEFPGAVEVAAAARHRHGLEPVKLVLITNATMFHRPPVRAALEVLSGNNGEVWAKLEAGTEEYYRQVERTTIPFRRILDNIAAEARRAPLIIQALFMRLCGEPPSEREREAFCERLNEIVQAGGRIKLVQVYTVARKPTESFVTPLRDAEVDALTALVGKRTALRAEAFYGAE